MPHWTLTRPAASAQLMLRLAGEYGLREAQCTAGTRLTREELTDPTREIAGEQELIVLRNILRALGPAIPFALTAGLRYRSTTHGLWGLALTSCPDVRRSIEIALQYFDLSYSFNSVSYTSDGTLSYLVYDDSENPDDLRAALVERDLAALITLERDIMGRSFPAHSLTLRSPRPPYAAMLESLFGTPATFDAEANRVGFDPALLDISQPLGDEFGLRTTVEQCRALLERRGERSGVAGRVRGRILRAQNKFPRMQTVAKELGMSTRTLRNRLKHEATSYREVIEQIRQTRAQDLLSTTQLTVDEIAARLGYADTSSFIIAFRRWSRVSPKEYRRNPGTPKES